MVRYHIIIHGDVCGVGFRYFTQRALLYGINGWVRNRTDGSVEIDAAGTETNLAVYIKSIEKGNRFSNIESTNLEKLDDMINYRSFDIIDDK